MPSWRWGGARCWHAHQYRVPQVCGSSHFALLVLSSPSDWTFMSKGRSPMTLALNPKTMKSQGVGLNPKSVKSQGVGCDEQREQGSDWGGVDHRHAQARPLTNRQGNLLDDEGCEPPPRLDSCASLSRSRDHACQYSQSRDHIGSQEQGTCAWWNVCACTRALDELVENEFA